MTRKIVRPTPVEEEGGPVRAEELRIARISMPNGWEDLHDKILRLWTIEPTGSSTAQMADLGVEPLRNPTIVEGEPHRHGATRAVLFEADVGVWALYALGSAASTEDDLDGDNAFVALTATVIRQLQPETLLVPELDRLIRDLRHVSQLWRVLADHVNEVRTCDERIGIHESYAEMRFMLSALAASTEAASIRRRTFWGKLQALVEGRTILGANAMPLGYHRREDHRVEPDPEQRPVVQAVVRAMAAGMSDRQIVDAAAAAGGTTSTIQRNHGPEATFTDHGNPAELARSWYATLELWRTGVRDQPIEALDEHRDDYESHPVYRDQSGKSYVVIDQQWGLPEGGWEDDDLLDAAMRTRDQRAARSRPTGGARHKRRRPLSGLVDYVCEGDDGWWHYKMFSDQQGLYQLRRRKLGDPSDRSRGWGRRPNLDGEVVARITCGLFHERLADGIVQAIHEGVPLEWLDGCRAWREGASLRLSSVPESSRSSIERRLEHARQRLSNLTGSIEHAPNERLRDRWVRRADLVQGEITDLEAELHRQEETEVVEPEEFDSEIGFLTACLALLRHTGNTADRELGDSLYTILDDLELRLEGGEAKWTVWVRIPARGGIARVRVTGSVPIGTRRQAESLKALRKEVTDAFMADGLTLEQTGQRFERRSTELVHRSVMAELRRHGLHCQARQYLAGHSPPPARQIVWAAIHRRPWPAEYDADYGRLVVAAYFSDSVGHPQSLNAGQVKAQRICDYLAQRGGAASQTELLSDLAVDGVTPAVLKTALSHRTSKTHLQRLRSLAVRRCPDRPHHIRLIDCPHCGGWARVVNRLPEVTQGVLCPDCRRMPVGDSPSFPSDYIHSGRQ